MCDRGVSTPVDVGLGLLLVGAAVGVIVGIQPVADPGPATGGSVMVASSLEVTYGTERGSATVSGTMGGLIGDAVLAGQRQPTARDRAFRSAVQAAVESRLETYNRLVQIVGYCKGADGGARIVAGGPVPPDRPIRASVYDVPAGDGTGGPGHASDGSGPQTATGLSTAPRLDAGARPSRSAHLGKPRTPNTCDPAIVVRRWEP